MDHIILIPAYKPDYKLKELVNNLKENYFKEIIIVDDGSGIGYNEIFDEIEEIKECHLIRYSPNKGKGHALKTGFNYIIDNYENREIGIVTVDADGQHSIKDIISVGNEIDSESIVLGVREFGDNTPMRSKVGNEFTKTIFKLMIGLSISDTQTGLRGFNIDILKDLIQIEGERYEYETNMLLFFKKKDINIKEVEIDTIYIEENESSHFNPIKDSIKIYLCLFKYCLSSIIAFLVDNIIFAIAISLLNNIFVSIIISRIISVVVNFTMNKSFVFKNSDKDISIFIKYCLLALFNVVVTSTILKYIVNKYSVNVIVFKILIETILYFTNFYIQKRYIFKNKD